MVPMKPTVRSTRALLVLAGLALVLRVATAIPLHQQAFTSDEKEYLLLATRIIDDHMFQDSNGDWSVKPPGYPAVIAGMLEVFGRTIFPMILFNAALGALAVVIGFLLVLDITGDIVAAWFTGGMLAFHPSLIIYGSVLQSEALYVVLMLVAVGIAIRLTRKPTVRLAALLGVLLAALTLTRAIGLVVIAALVGVLLLKMAAPGKRRILVLGCATGIAVLGLLPWTIRNYTVHHAFVPVSSFSGTSLLMGNNPYSDGTTALPPQYYAWVKVEASRRGFPALDSADEVVRDRVHAEIAVDWIVSHPAAWVRLLVRKMEVFWIYPVSTTADNHGVQAVAMSADVVLWAGGLGGILALCGKRKEILILSSVILVVTAAHVIMHTEARYRLPLIALLSLFFGPGAALLFDRSRWSAIGANRSAVACTAVVAFLVFLGYLAAGLMVLHGEA